jgi:hypothetical protein
LDGINSSKRIVLPIGISSRMPGPTDLKAYIWLAIKPDGEKSWLDTLLELERPDTFLIPAAIADSIVPAAILTAWAKDSLGYIPTGRALDPGIFAAPGATGLAAMRFGDFLYLEILSL